MTDTPLERQAAHDGTGAMRTDDVDDTLEVGEAGATSRDDGATPVEGTDGAAGVELGLQDGGSTFEPEEDAPAGSPPDDGT